VRYSAIGASSDEVDPAGGGGALDTCVKVEHRSRVGLYLSTSEAGAHLDVVGPQCTFVNADV